MVPVYFAHSYREEDSSLNKYFLNLMQDQGYAPCVDVPSNRLNAAKQERQLSFAGGFVAVLPQRDSGPSPYIMAEISLAVRAGKPALVFSEDTLPAGLFPDRVLKDRFSRKSFWRSTRDHLDAFSRLSTFVGDTLLPSQRSGDRPRSVCVLGFSGLSEEMRITMHKSIRARSYSVIAAAVAEQSDVISEAGYGYLRDASLIVAVLDHMTPAETYWLGFARGAAIPTIMLHLGEAPRLRVTVPAELAPRRIPDDPIRAVDILNTEIDIFEDEAFEIDRGDEIQKYIDFLKSASRRPGAYDSLMRTDFFSINSTTYNVDSAVSVGPNPTNMMGSESKGKS
jgi:hypothetical protein